MGTYRLSGTAAADLANIYRQSVVLFGTAQADVYHDGLEAVFIFSLPIHVLPAYAMKSARRYVRIHINRILSFTRLQTTIRSPSCASGMVAKIGRRNNQLGIGKVAVSDSAMSAFPVAVALQRSTWRHVS